MNFNGVVQALRSGHHIDRAVHVLINFNMVLNERDLEQLQEFTKDYNEKVEAGTSLKELVIPEHIQSLLQRPTAPIPALNAVMCVIGATKLQALPEQVQRALQKRVLPVVASGLAQAEWLPVLNASLHLAHGVNPSIAMLRCAEEVLRLSAKAVGAAATASLASSADGDAVQQRGAFEVWWKLLSTIIRRYAALHATNRKHRGDQSMLSCPSGHAAFLTSVRYVRLQRIVGKNDALTSSLAALVASAPSNQSNDVAPIALMLNRIDGVRMPITKALITTVAKNHPGALHLLFGSTLRIAAGTITATEVDDLILHCLYNLGLTTCTPGTASDFLVVLQALPSDQVRAYLAAHQADVLGQILNLFINHPKVYSVDFAPAVSASFARWFASCDALTGGSIQALAKLVAQAMHSRCRSGDEKACVLTVLESFCQAVQILLPGGGGAAAGEALLTAADVQPIVRTELDSAAASSRVAWSLIAVSGTASAMQTTINPLLKGAVNKESTRRVVLTELPMGYPDAALLTKPLLEECGDVEVYRTDAFFSLGFAPTSSPTLIAAASRIAVRADVIKSIGTSSTDLRRAAAVAASLAAAGHYGALALLLTHNSGIVRKELTSVVQNMCTQPSTVILMWDTLVKNVFGLALEEAPEICSPKGGASLLATIAPLVLRHTAKLVVHSALVEILLCCGHDHVVGADDLIMVSDHLTIGQYRSSSAALSRKLFDTIFSAHKHLLQQHHESISQGLIEMLSGPKHVAAAAARALSLFLFVSPPAVTVSLFRLMADRVRQSVTYFRGIDALDAAIASGSPQELAAYERLALTQRGLLKEYTPKPPKGVSEEDYEAMKKKDAIALKAGRETLAKEIGKRRTAAERDIRVNASIFVALRVIGATKACRHWDGIPVIYPQLLSILSQQPKVSVLYTLALDAIVNLLSGSSLAPVSQLIAELVGRLKDEKSLTASDVASVAGVAHHMRQESIVLLPPHLFSVLIPFCNVAFKAPNASKSKVIAVATQHQLLSVLNANAGQDGVPERAAAVSMYFGILRNFPSLFKAVQHGVQAVVGNLPAEDIKPLYDGLLNGVDVVKECAASAFPKFQHFDTTRTALVVAACMQTDDSTAVNQCMTVIVKQHQFEVQEHDWDDLILLLKSFGHRSITVTRISKVMDQLLTKAPNSQVHCIHKIVAIGGMAAVRTLELLAAHFTSSSTLIALEFLCGVAENSDASEDLMQAVLASGKALLQRCSIEALNQLAPQLQPRLKRPPTTSSADHKEQYLAIAVVWLTVIGCRVNDVAFLETIIDQQAAVLNTSTSANVHYFVCDSMAEISANKSAKESPKVIAFAENCLKVALTSGAYSKKKAHACGLAGVVQGLGLSSIRRLKIMEAIANASKEKQAQRSGAMIVVEVLCEVLGCNFEPYALSVAPLLLEAVSEKDVKISECADDAAKAMMRNLSDVGLRQLIPKLVQGLLSDQTKRRTPSLGFIGYVAFCSPKQLAATLPNIMKHICNCLFDANSSVSTAAYTALKRVAGVVSNPEIQEHVELILAAMRFPSSDTETALDALLYTRFVNVVDPASLALIVPVLQRGLDEQMRTKAKAAQIAASMVNLVADRKSLLPYVDELLLRLQNAAQDPMNDVRTTSAKAISALAATMSEDLVESVTEWVFASLRRSNTSAEKAGAAQVLAEVISTCGAHVLATNFATISKGMEDESANVREGFLHLMIYAPSTFPQAIFQDFLPVAFPWVLRGLSDFQERVRNVALIAGSSIIALYGTRNLGLVLNPLLEGVISETANLRHSSMLLASKLLIHLVNQIKKKLRLETPVADADGDTEAQPEDDTEDTSLAQGGEIRVETARDAEKRGVSILGSLEEQIGLENFVRILSAMHVGRSEHNLNVRNDCTTAWQICVASPRAAMTKIFAGIVTMLVKFASSPNAECVDVAEQSIEYTCARLNENVERFIERFSEQYKEGSRRHKIGAMTCLACVVQFGDSARLMKIGGQIVSCVLPGMQDEDPQVRDAAGLLFERVTKIVGSRLIESVVETQLATSIRGVLEVVKVRPSVALAVIFKNLHGRSEYTLHDLDLIENILSLEQAVEDLPKFLDRICDIILVCIAQNLDGACDVMTLFAEVLPEHSRLLPMAQFQRGMKHPSTKLATLRAVGAFSLGIDVEEVEGIEQLLRMIISSLGDDDEAVSETSVGLVLDVMASIEKRFMSELPPEDQEDVTTARRIAGRFMLQFLDVIQTSLAASAHSYMTSDDPHFTPLGTHPKLFDTFAVYYGKVLEWGTDPQKLQAVECILDLFSFAPEKVACNACAITIGRCTKVLFTRVAGNVAYALTNACLELLNKYSTTKEKVVESALALAMFNAVLSDSAPARVTTLRIVRRLLQKTPVHADGMLGNVATKKFTVDGSGPLKCVICRFVSFVMRMAKIEREHNQTRNVVPLIMALWEAPENAAMAAASGSAVGSLCMSATVSDEKLNEIVERTFGMTSTRGVQAVGGLATMYALLTASSKRLPSSFGSRAADAVRAIVPLATTDKFSSMWILRCAARLALAGVPLPADIFYPMLRRIDAEDEHGMSTAKFFCDAIVKVDPKAQLEGYNQEPSAQWLEHGSFDADMEDEAVAEVYF